MTHDFSRFPSLPLSVLHFKDYILFIKIAVLTAAPGRAVEAEPGAGSR